MDILGVNAYVQSTGYQGVSTKFCIASQTNGIRIVISEWGKNNIEPLREHPMVLLTIKSIQHERFNNQLSGRT